MPQLSDKQPRGFRPDPFRYHEEIELEISTLTNMGHGLARTNDNWVVLVPYCLPGETVKARVYRNHQNFSEADLLEVKTPSPHRVNPQCKLFGSCGGCQYQHIEYQEQLKWKKRQVEELLKHMIGIDTEVDPVIPSPLEYHYRTKITPHFDRPKEGNVGPIGFQRPGRRSLIDIKICPIAQSAINSHLPILRSQVNKRSHSFKKGATLLLRSDINGTIHTDPASIVTDQVGQIRFRFPAGCFFQNNSSILEDFTSHVRREAKSSGTKYLVDAYCGVGLFSLTSAPSFEKVIGIEISEASIHWAKCNAKLNNIENAYFLPGRVEDLFEKVGVKGNDTVVVIDPPRKGCSEQFLRQLFEFSPRSVVYVSCNPATQMRDLDLFQRAGFKLNRVQPFDLFPQTKHLECVITLAQQSVAQSNLSKETPSPR